VEHFWVLVPMTTDPHEVIYCGIWTGLGKIYHIKVENGYTTTIIVKPGESLTQRAKETREKFCQEGEPSHQEPRLKGPVV
jgi:hypothetical protein